MALEAVVLQQDLFVRNGNWASALNFGVEKAGEKGSYKDILHTQTESYHYSDSKPPTNSSSSSSEADLLSSHGGLSGLSTPRQKRRRCRSRKNEEDIENQRMTHITVERNRRRQMNEYLSLLRSLMPESYVQRGDQASIIGGAINFVKQLEHILQLLQKETTMARDVEVSMVESYANLKIRSPRGDNRLSNIVSGLQNLNLSVNHLNVSTVDRMTIYTMNLKVEDDCILHSADEIAGAVHLLLNRPRD